LSTSRRCPHCQQWFVPSIYHPQQTACSQPDCQRRRRREYHRRKLRTDPLYRQVAQDSQKKWRVAHPEYLREYRAKHPAAVARNRERQQVRDQKPRLAFLEKNNLAFDLKRSLAGVWLVGPGVGNLEKNNLASAQLLIFQPLASVLPAASGS
jgi:hypothetical protein